jgi:UDP-N-acetylmuramoyl-tripeptide--D-alanyl-D-alanine ligase
MKLSQIATVVGGELVGLDAGVRTFSTDTRALAEGDMFIALSGPNFDANNFVAKAAEAGAAAALVSRVDPSAGIPQVLVADTFVALGRLGKAWREQFELTRVAITGSAGKTTTKEMMASIFDGMGSTLATLGNKNNEIGVPLTLLRLSDAHRFGVFELGANHKGEIAYTSGLVAPHAAVITNVGSAHLEGFGSRQGIAEAKGEIYGGLTAEGVVVINHDDEFAPYWRELTRDRQQIEFSLSSAVAVHASHVRMGVNHAWAFTLHVGSASAPVQLQLLGRHNVMNALAAAALAHACHVPLEMIVRGLENTRPVAGRLVLKSAGKASVVIDDTYNANPASVKAAIDVLADLPGRRVLVLGDMGELGDATVTGHNEVGEYAKMKKIDALYTVGHYSSFAANSFGAGAQAFQEKQLLIEELEKELEGVVTLLVKGSRSARMEQVVDALTDKKES